MTTLASISFTRADSADLGSDFDANTGTSSTGMEILSNAAHCPSGISTNDTAETYNVTSCPSEGWIEFALGTVTASGVGAGYGVLWFSDATAKTYYRLVANGSGWEFGRFNAGAFTSLGSGSTAFANGDVGRLEITISGANRAWVVKKNGTTVSGGTGTDTSPLTSGRAGVGYSSLDATASGITDIVFGDFSSGATLEQADYRVRNDDGSETGATWAAAQGSDPTSWPMGTRARLRFLINATGDPGPSAFQIEVQKNGAGGYSKTPVGASVAEAYGTVTFGAIGTGANGSTTVAPSYPSGITAGQYLVAVVTSGATNSETPTDSGSKWTLLATGASTDGTYGVDTGPRRVTAFGCIADGSESGTYTFNITNGGTCRGTISRFTKAGSGDWVVDAVGGDDSTSGTGFSVTLGSVNWNTGDATLVAVGQRVDTVTQSSQSLTASGVTFGSRTNQASTAVTTGNDHRHVVDTFAAVSGTSNVNAAPTWSYTGSAACSGGCVIVRLREYTAPVTNEVYIDASANIAASAATSTTSQLTGGSGTFVASRISDDTNPLPATDIGSSGNSEPEFAINTQSPAANGDYFDFRITVSGTPLATYTKTPRLTLGTGTAQRDESITLTAGQAAQADFSASRGESVALTSSEVATAVFSTTRGESVGLSDSVTAQADFATSRAEAVALTDGTNAQADFSAARGESVAFSDGTTTQADFTVSRAEAVTFVDGQDASLVSGVLSVDHLLLMRSNRPGWGPYSRGEFYRIPPFYTSAPPPALPASLADAVTFTAAQTAQTDFAAARGEAIAFSDGQGATLDAQLEAGETFMLADAQTAHANLATALGEAISLGDAQGATAVLTATAAEAVLFSDAQTGTSGADLQVGESIAFSAGQSAQADLSAALGETVALTEAQGAGVDSQASRGEAIALADGQVAGMLLAAQRGEALGLTDAQAATRTASVAAADALALADGQDATILAGVATAGDSLSLSDDQYATAMVAAVVAEAIAFAEIQAGVIDAGWHEVVELTSAIATTVELHSGITTVVELPSRINLRGPPSS